MRVVRVWGRGQKASGCDTSAPYLYRRTRVAACRVLLRVCTSVAIRVREADELREPRGGPALARRARGGRRDSFGTEVSEEDLRRKRRASLLSADSARSRKGHKDKPGRATCRGSASSSTNEILEA